MLRIPAIFLTVTCTLLATFWLLFARPASEPPAPSASPNPRLESRVSEIREHSPAGGTHWTLQASSIRYADKDRRAVARDVTCAFLDAHDVLLVTVLASGCTFDQTSGNMQFHGRVRAHDPLGQALSVENLRWDATRRLFLGHGGVRFTRATSELTGDRVAASPDLRQVELSGHIVAQVRTVDVGSR